MELRWYQKQAVNAVYEHLAERDDNPCVVMPTGSGKSPTMAQIVRDAVGRWKGRVAILAHRRELLEQNAEKVKLFAPGIPFGIYSAGLGRRETGEPVIVAGIQSVFRRAFELAPFNLVIVDEAHRIATQGEGMYRTFIAESLVANPELRVIGFTATPYRMDSGLICAPENILNEVCYEIAIKPLVDEGFLSRLISRSGVEDGIIDTEGIHTRGGEFVSGELEERALSGSRVARACADMVALCSERRKILVFCCGVRHAENVKDSLEAFGETALCVTGETKKDERRTRLEDFRAGRVKYMVNVFVLTEGFDVQDIDAIVILRPTKSPGLYSQMVGRGLRVHPAKEDTLVLDYGENILRHGPIDAVVPPKKQKKSEDDGEPEPEEETVRMKVCPTPTCRSIMPVESLECLDCGYVFPEPEPDHSTRASDMPILSRPRVREWLGVEKVYYEVHRKRGAPDNHPKTLRVDYRVSFHETISEWVCVEFPEGSYPRQKAMRWWRKHQGRDGAPVRLPQTSAEAAGILSSGRMLEPRRIEVLRGRSSREFDEVVGYEFPLRTGELLSELNAQTAETASETADTAEEEVPF